MNERALPRIALPRLESLFLFAAMLLALVLEVLLYRFAAMLRPLRSWGFSEMQRNRNGFFRLWRWTAELGSVQMAALCLDRTSFGVR